MTTQPYFNQIEYRNTALRWAIATRMQLDLWEPLLAAYARQERYADEPRLSVTVWETRTTHHLSVVAAAHMVRALDHLSPRIQGVSSILRDEIIQTRDLLEHWPDNQPVFNQRPRPSDPPKPSGKKWAQQNPGRSPYSGWRLVEANGGPMLTPNVSASEARAMIGRVERYAIQEDPMVADYIPEQLALRLWDQDGWPLLLPERTAPRG